MFCVVLHPRAIRFIKRLPRKQAINLQRKIESLNFSSEKKSLNLKKMKLAGKSWRLRVGSIRVLYEVLDKEKIIWVSKVDFRG